MYCVMHLRGPAPAAGASPLFYILLSCSSSRSFGTTRVVEFLYTSDMKV